MSATQTSPSRGTSRSGINPWFIAAAVSIATFMEVLDTSIANVALRNIAGGLSAAESDSEWVITSYLAANAAVLLLSGWLSVYFGRRNDYLFSVAVFTISSVTCGLASSLELTSVLCRAGAPAHPAGTPDAAIGGREGRPCRGRVVRVTNQ